MPFIAPDTWFQEELAVDAPILDTSYAWLRRLGWWSSIVTLIVKFQLNLKLGRLTRDGDKATPLKCKMFGIRSSCAGRE